MLGAAGRSIWVRPLTETLVFMPYMAFSQYTGDTSNIEADLELPRQKLIALGASRVTGSIALTGEAAGSFTVASIWDTADGYFDARAQVASSEAGSPTRSRGPIRMPMNVPMPSTMTVVTR